MQVWGDGNANYRKLFCRWDYLKKNKQRQQKLQPNRELLHEIVFKKCPAVNDCVFAFYNNNILTPIRRRPRVSYFVFCLIFVLRDEIIIRIRNCIKETINEGSCHQNNYFYLFQLHGSRVFLTRFKIVIVNWNHLYTEIVLLVYTFCSNW